MTEIPLARDTDSEDVVWGLQTAASLWKRGERSDAVAWLRRAAQAASDANDDDRALELARVAAELAESVNQAATMMPPSSPPQPEETTSLDAVPQPADADPMNALPPSSHAPSVPPAEKLHAGILDPWNEGAPVSANVVASTPPEPAKPRMDEPPAPAVIHVPSIPSSPDLSKFTEHEIVTSVAQVPSRPPKQPPPVPSKKPPPLPPRAQQSGSRKPPPLPPSAPKVPQIPPSSPTLPESSPRLAAPPEELHPITIPPDAAEPEPAPRHDTPPPVSPTQRYDIPPVRSVEQEAEEREHEDEESSAETTPPPPAEVPADEAPTPFTPSVAAKVGPLLTDDDLAETPLAPAVASAAPAPAPAEGEPPKLDLEGVELFSDLPDDARADFANAGKVHVLAEGEEVAGFALAYVMEGSFDVAATMVDAAAVRLAQGAVLRARGTTNEGVPMRIISTSPRSTVATWTEKIVEEAFKHCPWVEDDLRAASDRVMMLVGITIGPLGERLDQSIREEIVGRLTVRPLIPGEIVVNKGEPVPGLLLVGVGEIELVDGDDVKGVVGSGDFLFATEVLGAGAAPQTARAGAGGALVMFGNRSVAQELMVTCPPLLEVFAGM